MAGDMFLKIENIKGESVDDKHKDEIDILSWSWGASQSGTTHMAQGGGSGKANFSDINIVKYVDKATPTLWNYLSTGTHFKEAVLTVRKAGGKEPLEYLIITMKEGIVSSIGEGGSDGEAQLTEQVALNFSEFKIEYKAQKADGSGEAAIKFAWDIASNKETS